MTDIEKLAGRKIREVEPTQEEIEAIEESRKARANGEEGTPIEELMKELRIES